MIQIQLVKFKRGQEEFGFKLVCILSWLEVNFVVIGVARLVKLCRILFRIYAKLFCVQLALILAVA